VRVRASGIPFQRQVEVEELKGRNRATNRPCGWRRSRCGIESGCITARGCNSAGFILSEGYGPPARLSVELFRRAFSGRYKKNLSINSEPSVAKDAGFAEGHPARGTAEPFERSRKLRFNHRHRAQRAGHSSRPSTRPSERRGSFTPVLTTRVEARHQFARISGLSRPGVFHEANPRCG
jgi:hypothetical protein